MTIVLVNGPLEVNGRRYEVGDPVDHLPEFVTERLLLHGQAVSDAAAPPPEPDPDPDPEPSVVAEAPTAVTPAAELTKAQLQDELTAAGRPFAKKDGHPKLAALVEALRAEAA